MRAALAALLLALGGCASLSPSALPEAVTAALLKQGLPAESLGLLIEPLAGGSPLLARRANEPLATGSTMKLVTAAVALDALGPNSRGRTELLAARAPEGGVLDGPLILRGGADSELDWAALWWLLRELRERGVREVRGGLVVDRGLFDPARLDVGVPPFDEAPEADYNVIPDALHFQGSLLDVEIVAEGQVLSARSIPALPGLRLDASGLRPSDAACKDWDEAWQAPLVTPEGEGWLVTLQGAFPRGCRQRVALNVLDRQWLVARAVRLIWAELGGSLGAGDAEGRTPPGAVVLASHRSRPLAETLRGVLKRSDNALTRLIYLRLGAAASSPPEPTRDAAERSVRAWFKARGIDDSGLVLDNGSGLSRSERASPAQFAALLRAARNGPHGNEFMAGLPVAGVDGTLSRRLKDGPATGRARLKTGTLRDVVGLAGFVRDAAEREWVFVALLNHPDAATKGRPVLDALVEWLAARR